MIEVKLFNCFNIISQNKQTQRYLALSCYGITIHCINMIKKKDVNTYGQKYTDIV